MTNYMLRAVILFAIVLSVSLASAQVPYDTWDFPIVGTNAVTSDSLCSLGVRTDATSGFDNQYDIPRPPRSPSGVYVELYFPHSGGTWPPLLGDKYAIDYQGPSNPTWHLSVEASDPGQLTLTWDSSYVNSIAGVVQLFLYDSGNGSVTNMRLAGRYSFNYTAKRNFRIAGAVTVDLRYLMEGFWNGAAQVQDTVTGYLAASTTPYGFVDSARAALDATGAGILTFPYAPDGSYYIVVRHRNHLEVWSGSPQALTNSSSSATPYDFSTGAGTAYGTNALKQEGAVTVAWAGDVNQDGVIDFLDRNLTWNNRSLGGYLSTDCNGDNVTDAADAAVVLANRLKVRQHP